LLTKLSRHDENMQNCDLFLLNRLLCGYQKSLCYCS